MKMSKTHTIVCLCYDMLCEYTQQTWKIYVWLSRIVMRMRSKICGHLNVSTLYLDFCTLSKHYEYMRQGIRVDRCTRIIDRRVWMSVVRLSALVVSLCACSSYRVAIHMNNNNAQSLCGNGESTECNLLSTI